MYGVPTGLLEGAPPKKDKVCMVWKIFIKSFYDITIFYHYLTFFDTNYFRADFRIFITDVRCMFIPEKIWTFGYLVILEICKSSLCLS